MSTRRLIVATIVAFAATLVIAPPDAARADDELGPLVAGEFVVELKDDADAAEVNRAVGGVAPPERMSPSSTLWLFHLDAATDPEDGAKLIKNADRVVDAQPNLLADLPEFYGGRIRFWTDFGPPDATSPASAATIDQPALGSAGLPAPGPTGAGSVVAVLDTGLDTAHPAFTDRLADGGHDFVDDDPAPDEESNGSDDNGNGAVDEAYGHGTYVAGIVRLVAADARILPIRILDTDGVTTSWRILQGLDRAVSHDVEVVNLSLGGRYLGDIVARAVAQLEKLGIAVVAAAGNSGTTELRYPAAFSGVIGVTAIDGATGQVATFSNTGSWIDLAAPGVRVVAAYPENRYAVWGGTSAAAPVVAAALALVREVMPTADVDDVADKLTSTAIADDLPNATSYGRIDVIAAVTSAITR